MIKNKYVIVGGPKIGPMQIQYRRIRYMNYLSGLSPNNDVYWLYASNGSLSDFGKIKRGSFLSATGERITSLEVSDFYFLLGRGFLGRFIGKKIAKIIGKMKVEDTLIYTVPRFSRLALHFKEPNIVYDVSDNWIGQYPLKSIKSAILRVLIYLTEKRIVNSSKKIIASSVTLKKNLESRFNKEVFLASNGVDYEVIKNCPKASDFDHRVEYEKIIGFSGTMMNREIKDKIDVSLLIFLAKKRPKWCFIIIGPYSEVPLNNIGELRSMSNVVFMGYVDPRELGGYLKHLDVGLLPYIKNEFTDGILPIKLYEYIAACLPIVAINLPATRFLSLTSKFYRLTDDYDSFLEACDDLVNMQMSTKEKETYPEVAKSFDWKNVFDDMTEYMRP